MLDVAILTLEITGQPGNDVELKGLLLVQ